MYSQGRRDQKKRAFKPAGDIHHQSSGIYLNPYPRALKPHGPREFVPSASAPTSRRPCVFFARCSLILYCYSLRYVMSDVFQFKSRLELK